MVRMATTRTKKVLIDGAEFVIAPLTIRQMQELLVETAKAKEDVTNTRGAAMDLGKLCGLIVDKQEVTSKDVLTAVDGESLWNELKRRMELEKVGDEVPKQLDNEGAHPLLALPSTVCLNI